MIDRDKGFKMLILYFVLLGRRNYQRTFNQPHQDIGRHTETDKI